jgi:hypothetical protein
VAGERVVLGAGGAGHAAQRLDAILDPDLELANRASQTAGAGGDPLDSACHLLRARAGFPGHASEGLAPGPGCAEACPNPAGTFGLQFPDELCNLFFY